MNPPLEAIFFDRDGTLIEDKHYLKSPDDITYLPKIFDYLKILHKRQVKLFIVTNQSGVGRGFFSLYDVFLVHQKIHQDLKEKGIAPFTEYLVCPHHPEHGCQCRKPQSALLQKTCKKYLLNATNCIMVGDKKSDLEAGENLGMKSFSSVEDLIHSLSI